MKLEEDTMNSTPTIVTSRSTTWNRPATSKAAGRPSAGITKDSRSVATALLNAIENAYNHARATA